MAGLETAGLDTTTEYGWTEYGTEYNCIRKITLYFFGLFGLLKVQKGKKVPKAPDFFE